MCVCYYLYHLLGHELLALAALLRRHIQQAEAALRVQHLPHDPLLGVLVGGGGEHVRPDPEPPQRHHLVLHQAEQRRHHQRHAGAHHRRQLVTQGLAPASGHCKGNMRSDRVLR